jgi:hypothetical protein
MRPWTSVAAALLALAALACASPSNDSASDAGWVGTITTEGNVTTVINESGSVWGGAATLVEELSIGVERGEPEYMLGPPRTLWDAGDRIIVPDWSAPTVRVFDAEGRFVGEIGRGGQGPGEYQRPWSAIPLPDGRIAVSNSQSEWVDLFSRDLRYLERWEAAWNADRPAGALPHGLLHLTEDGTLYLSYTQLRRDEGRAVVRWGWKPIGPLASPAVAVWEPLLDKRRLRNCLNPECTAYALVPYRPDRAATFTPTAAVVSGFSDEYRFEISARDGTTTVVQRYWDPVMLEEAEWEYWMQRIRAQGVGSRYSANWRPSWSAEVPRVKPAFVWFHAGRSGRILVVREGPSRRVEPCTHDPQPGDREFVACYESTPIWDLFESDGRYLGEVVPPSAPMRPFPFLDGDRFTMAVDDEAGTIMVKRYRLVPPGER